MRGLICRIESKDCYVLPENGGESVRCSLRGKFKKEYALKKDKLYRTDIVAVGDYVFYEMNRDGSGVINEIDDRRNYLSRKAPKIKGASYRGERLEQIVAANIDTLFIVSSVDEPLFNNKVIDRFIVAAESSGIDAKIVLNKIDLDPDGELDYFAELYKKIGYSVFKTSCIDNKGLTALKDDLLGKKNLFWGQSGVGKSSLLNNLYPELDFNVGEISNYSFKGTHTTVTSVMVEVEKNTFIVDTPGIREIDPFGIRKEDLGHYFAEFGDFLNQCKFNTCTHTHEPGCAVIEAVENGNITEERYDSYLRILNSVEDDIVF